MSVFQCLSRLWGGKKTNENLSLYIHITVIDVIMGYV